MPSSRESSWHTYIYNLFFFRFFSLIGYYNICCCCPVAKSRPALGNPTNCSMPGSSVHGIPQARVLEWVAMPSSRDLPNLGIEPTSHISCIARWILYPLAPPGKHCFLGLLKFMSIESEILSNHLSLCCYLLLLPSTFWQTYNFKLPLHILQKSCTINGCFNISPSRKAVNILFA